MRNPIDNLGDYNRVREDLQKVGGSRRELYESIGRKAVERARPKIVAQTGGILFGLVGIIYIGKKGIFYLKERKNSSFDCEVNLKEGTEEGIKINCNNEENVNYEAKGD